MDKAATAASHWAFVLFVECRALVTVDDLRVLVRHFFGLVEVIFGNRKKRRWSKSSKAFHRFLRPSSSLKSLSANVQYAFH